MRILFPVTNRVHKARQQLLLNELGKYFDLDVEEYQSPYKDILNAVADTANHFRSVLRNNYDLIIVRGDRFEMLPIAMVAAYKGIRVAHIEGGDMSGAIDNKVRHAITQLSEIHFATNKESYSRLIRMGTDPDWTFNFGSLDVEYAKSVKIGEHRDTVVICYHPMPGEDPAIVEKIVRDEFQGEVVVIKSNSDNGTPYGKEEFKPEEYINLIATARCLVGNSSSFLKEASAFGTPVLNIGERQRNRLKPDNVKDVPFDEYQIRQVLKIQLGQKYHPSDLYYQENTSQKICEKISKLLLLSSQEVGAKEFQERMSASSMASH